MILLVDSSIIIDLLRDYAPTADAVHRAALSAELMAISVITTAEIYAGMHDREALLTEGLLRELHHFPVTPAIAKRAGEMKNSHARKGRTLELDDMLIAATAIEHECQLMTLNVKHFRGTGVLFHNSGEELN
jgi:predicted nucleic acid-binding protein